MRCVDIRGRFVEFLQEKKEGIFGRKKNKKEMEDISQRVGEVGAMA